MYLLILLLPLLSSFSKIFTPKFSVFGSIQYSITLIICTFLLSCYAFYEVALTRSSSYIEIFKWFDSELISFSWGFLFDSVTVTMLVVVTAISMCVHLYSTEYMVNDPHLQRFISYLSLFTFFMLILITADNFFQMFLGWEGVGLCSYLLVNFWFGRLQANKAAIKAMVVNRVGDMGLALSLFLIYYCFQTFDYSIIFALAPYFQNYSLNFFNFNVNIITLICFFFFIAAVGKSAQIGLHSWLPDAMEGPTPVSALIHAATMVTAGVYLIIRCSPLFENAPTISLIITASGAITAFLAASVGFLQNDLKRVIAYSTCSQLGYMMIACGTSGYNIGLFHLTNHAFFKALLFLGAGAIIHSLSDEQDMRKMGSLVNLLPFTYSMMLIGSLSLMGFPFLTGFYSKDLILEWTFGYFSINSLFAYSLGALSAFFTAFYSLRVVSLTFLKKPSESKNTFLSLHESSFKMAFPLFFLSLFSIFLGYFLKDMFVGVGTDFWNNSILILLQNNCLIEAEFLNSFIKLLPVILSLLGGISAFILYNFFFYKMFFIKISYFGRNVYNFLNRKWFFDKIYIYWLTQFTLKESYSKIYQNLDRGLVELFGPTGISSFLYQKSTSYKKMYNIFILIIERLKNLYPIHFLFFFSVVFFYFLLFWFATGMPFSIFIKEFPNFSKLIFELPWEHFKLYVWINYREEYAFIGKHYNQYISTLNKGLRNIDHIIYNVKNHNQFTTAFIDSVHYMRPSSDYTGLCTLAGIFEIKMYPKTSEGFFLYYLPSELYFFNDFENVLKQCSSFDNFGNNFRKSSHNISEDFFEINAPVGPKSHDKLETDDGSFWEGSWQDFPWEGFPNG